MTEPSETVEHLKMLVEYHKEVSACMVDPRTVLSLFDEIDRLRAELAWQADTHRANVDVIKRLDVENVQLRAEINGTEWENDLLAHAPDWLDDDVAQSETVTQYVRLLEGVIEALRGAWPLLRGCAHDWDPQCARCQWLKPLSDALAALGDGGEGD